MTVNMKIDLVGKERRGLALGLNEFAGYLSVAVVGFVTGYLAATYGLKPYPFFIGIAFVLVGFIISWLVVKDTRKFTLLEIKENQEELTRKITTENNDHPHISSTAANEKKSFGTLSDKVGRKILIYPGMFVQGIGIWVVLFLNSMPE
jgi:MFS family permease